MDRFQAMQVFTRVVDANSFTRAADSLGLPRTTVTNIIQGLERLLQVRLLNRTTRKLSLTTDGAAYYERCIRILADVEETEASFHESARGPKGRLRVDMPASIARTMVIPQISSFYQTYPDLELMIGMGDRPVDMVQEAVDCVVRVGELADSSMVARRIGVFESITCAAPSYVAQYGTPNTIDDLAHHRAVQYFSSTTGRDYDWDFVIDGQDTEVRVPSVLSTNDSDAYLDCGLQGLGLIKPPVYMALPYLRSGQLIEVLPNLISKPQPISVIYLHNRHLSSKVRAFVDWIAERFEACPLLNKRLCDVEFGEKSGHEVCIQHTFAAAPRARVQLAAMDDVE